MINTGERISVFDMFKTGIGPSSSHTMGPWKAALSFLKKIDSRNLLHDITGLNVVLFGSLAKTGKGHGTDRAIILGLLGEKPDKIDPESIQPIINEVRENKKLKLKGRSPIDFDPASNILFNKDVFLTFHPNGITFEAVLAGDNRISETYYSVGGGFVVKDVYPHKRKKEYQFPYPVDNSSDLLRWTKETGLSISEVVYLNELSITQAAKVQKNLDNIWKVMVEGVYRGCHNRGMLPGGLQVKRRAPELNMKLLPGDNSTTPDQWIELIRSKEWGFREILKWVSCFALAVNEENAAFGRIVTAPTNGAAGVIPAVIMYMICFTDKRNEHEIRKFLLTASEIGSIFKKGSTISAAMGGCQAEIGVSSAMAAAALAECLGEEPSRAIMAAEIAMEHHLGLTCDPVGGLVQIPCIERNSMGAVKAITASQLASETDPKSAKVTLDNVIKTMWDTAQDMNSKYKETSDGGLAINIPVNITEC